jgi:hypothetical protein
VGHRVKPSVQNLIIHRKDKYLGKIFFHQLLEIRGTLAVHMASLAGRRSVRLGLKGRHAKNESPIVF